jgi:hypothetical protein
MKNTVEDYSVGDNPLRVVIPTCSESFFINRLQKDSRQAGMTEQLSIDKGKLSLHFPRVRQNSSFLENAKQIDPTLSAATCSTY